MILFEVLAQKKKIVKEGASQFQDFRVNFHKFHALFFTRLSQLGYAITGAHKTQGMASALTFFFYSGTTNMAMNFAFIGTGDETWVSFVNVETREQSEQWMYTHSPDKPKTFKQTLSACQKADGSCFLGQERSADGGIHATRDHRNVTSVL
jgi:hypothetical protein